MANYKFSFLSDIIGTSKERFCLKMPLAHAYMSTPSKIHKLAFTLTVSVYKLVCTCICINHQAQLHVKITVMKPYTQGSKADP